MDDAIEPRTLLLELRQALREAAADNPCGRVVTDVVLKQMVGALRPHQLTGRFQRAERALVEALDAVDCYLERQT